MNTKLVILDRDGTINRASDEFVKSPEEWQPLPGALEAIGRLNHAGYHVVLATNQSGLARGFFDEAAVDAFHAAMQEDLAADGARIDAFYACFHHADASVPRYRVADHPDRKPNPGMILRAMADHAIVREGSFLVGDRDSDIAAARAAGIPGHLFAGGDLDALLARLL